MNKFVAEQMSPLQKIGDNGFFNSLPPSPIRGRGQALLFAMGLYRLLKLKQAGEKAPDARKRRHGYTLMYGVPPLTTQMGLYRLLKLKQAGEKAPDARKRRHGYTLMYGVPPLTTQMGLYRRPVS